jgi:hypothetical protein
VSVCVNGSLHFSTYFFELHIDGDGEEGSNLMANEWRHGIHFSLNHSFLALLKMLVDRERERGC